jgi:hypothetical protein
MTDLSFLLSVSTLKNVVINNFTSDSSSKGYYLSSSFKYLLHKFTQRNVNVFLNTQYIYDAYGLNDDFAVDYSVSQYNKIPNTSGYTAQRVYIKANSKQEKANTYLDEFTVQNTYGSLINDSIIRFTNYEETNNVLTLHLPAAIEVNGFNNIIKWETGNKFITIGSYHLNNSITIAGTTYASGNLTQEQAETILGSVEYYSAHKSGTVDVTVLATVHRQRLLTMMEDLSSIIVARIKVDDYTYDRMFTVKI